MTDNLPLPLAAVTAFLAWTAFFIPIWAEKARTRRRNNNRRNEMTDNAYAVGDLVEATKGEERLSGRLVEEFSILKFHSGFHWHFPGDLARHGWTITVIEKAKPKVELPTEPGLYEGALYPVRAGYGPYRLSLGGKWFEGGEPLTRERARDFSPFTRLEPRAVTAKAVLDAVDRIGHIDGDSAINLRHGLKSVAAEFGVTTNV